MSTRDRKRGPRVVDPADRALFESAMGDVKPLPGQEPEPKAAPPLPPVKSGRKATISMPAARAARNEPPLVPGSTAGVDRRTVERLRRGRLAVEAVLDLHGHTQQEAHRALERFVTGGVAAGRRCVLVITGKGAVGSGGVLRRQVPQWLGVSPLRGHVLALTPAQAKHGGAGAFYVLLRRQRG
jgi:DNA-nicking Smr family endonuclease